MVIHKFHDLDGDGVHDTGEPPLAGIRFDIRVGDRLYPETTDQDGIIRLQLPEPARVEIRELSRPSGGQWRRTGSTQTVWQLDCGTTEVWIGNAQIRVPPSGRGDSRLCPTHGVTGWCDYM